MLGVNLHEAHDSTLFMHSLPEAVFCLPEGITYRVGVGERPTDPTTNSLGLERSSMGLRLRGRSAVFLTQDLCRLQFIQPPKPADDVKNCVKVINYTVNTQEKK